jgi:hypothetical protein
MKQLIKEVGIPAEYQTRNLPNIKRTILAIPFGALYINTVLNLRTVICVGHVVRMVEIISR